MFSSTLKSAHTARRRMRSLQRAAAAANAPPCITVSRLPTHTASAFDDLRGRHVHAVALVVLAVHCAVALNAWRASMENTAHGEPRALDVQFDVSAAVPAAIPTRPAGLAADPVPTAAPPTPSRSIAPRRMRDVAAPGSTAQASPSKALARPAANKTASTPQSAARGTTPQSASTHADAESLNAPIAQPPDSQPKTEPLTEPGFGAAYLHNPPPDYPGAAQQRGWQGTVLLKVHVLASGLPDHVGLASSSGHESLDDAAVEAVTRWRFTPARRGAQAIDGWVQVPIDFKLGT